MKRFQAGFMTSPHFKLVGLWVPRHPPPPHPVGAGGPLCLKMASASASLAAVARPMQVARRASSFEA